MDHRKVILYCFLLYWILSFTHPHVQYSHILSKSRLEDITLRKRLAQADIRINTEKNRGGKFGFLLNWRNGVKLHSER